MSTRVQVPVRLGEALLDKIDRAAGAEEQTRNAWLVETIDQALAEPGPSVPVFLQEVAGKRKPIVLRVEPRLLARLDRRREKLGLSRTMWLIEAISSRLTAYVFDQSN